MGSGGEETGSEVSMAKTGTLDATAAGKIHHSKIAIFEMVLPVLTQQLPHLLPSGVCRLVMVLSSVSALTVVEN
jgi:hypothetical protein